MKLFKILFLLFVSLFGYSQSSFDKANELYKQDKYEEAIQEYQKILDSGMHSVEVYYNLGNCYYKLNQIAPSIYNYEKALLLEPNNKMVKNNLKFAQNMMIDEIKEVPKVGFSNWLGQFTAVYHYDKWAKIAIGFSFLVLISFVGYYFSRKMLVKRISFAMLFVFFGISVLAIFISIFEKNKTEDYQPAIVFAESLAVKAEPKTIANNEVIIHEGAKVFILDKVDNWYEVELLDGKTGWVQESGIKSLK